MFLAADTGNKVFTRQQKLCDYLILQKLESIEFENVSQWNGQVGCWTRTPEIVISVNPDNAVAFSYNLLAFLIYDVLLGIHDIFNHINIYLKLFA